VAALLLQVLSCGHLLLWLTRWRQRSRRVSRVECWQSVLLQCRTPTPGRPLPSIPHTLSAGTPHRIAKLLEDGSLALSHAQLVLVDVHPDVKGYDILQHPNIKEDVFTLYRDHVHALVTAGKVKLAFY